MTVRLDSLSQLPVMGEAPEDSAEGRAKAAQGLTKAAQGLTAMFLRQLMSEMRKGTGGGLLDGGYAGTMFREMLDEALADKMAEADQLGMSGILQQQLDQLQGAASGTEKPLPPSPSALRGVREVVRLYSSQPMETMSTKPAAATPENSPKGSTRAVETDTGEGGR